VAAALLRRFLANPLTSNLSLDDPATTQLRKQIVSSKPFLQAIYNEWYGMLAAALPDIGGDVLELGSGAGYCERFIPGLITSEVLFMSGVRLIANGQELPFPDNSLKAIVLTDVMHHLPSVQKFLGECRRCLRSVGKILMIEPWVTPWSSFVYTKFHHEPFRPDAQDWSFPSSGPLSGANGALPWIVFARDREHFECDFPELLIELIRPFMPFRYLLSGGVGMRSLMPGITHNSWAAFERMLEGQMANLAMFAFISIRRR
jgi:SAM-dependent methyltransferase